MVQFVGTYNLVEQSSPEDYLKALGLSAESVKGGAGMEYPLIIKAVDDKKVVTLFGGQEVSLNVNAETEYELPPGNPVKAVVSVSGDTITIKTTSKNGKFTEEKELKFTSDGVTRTATINGTKHVSRYARA